MNLSDVTLSEGELHHKGNVNVILDIMIIIHLHSHLMLNNEKYYNVQLISNRFRSPLLISSDRVSFRQSFTGSTC